MNMDNDEEILKVFRRAAEKGRKSISIDSLIMLTNIQPRRLQIRLQNLAKYGYIKETAPAKKPKYWKFLR